MGEDCSWSNVTYERRVFTQHVPRLKTIKEQMRRSKSERRKIWLVSKAYFKKVPYKDRILIRSGLIMTFLPLVIQ